MNAPFIRNWKGMKRFLQRYNYREKKGGGGLNSSFPAVFMGSFTSLEGKIDKLCCRFLGRRREYRFFVFTDMWQPVRESSISEHGFQTARADRRPQTDRWYEGQGGSSASAQSTQSSPVTCQHLLLRSYNTIQGDLRKFEPQLSRCCTS